MTRKYQLITEIYDETAKEVVRNKENWQRFLKVAGKNYKLRFDEQLLVYAQRPDATAILEMEKWNRIFHRWVNRGARGIAVFADTADGRPRLKHYFDISDTHEIRNAIPVPVWNMKAEYDEAVIESLEGVYGDLERKGSLAEAVLSAAENGAEDHYTDYFQDFMQCKEGSLLEEMDEENLTVIFRETLAESIAYLIGSRLDLPEKESEESFLWISQFNTKDVLHAVGYATVEVAAMGLAEIAKTIRQLERENRRFDDRNSRRYIEEKERRKDHGNHIHDEKWRPDRGSGNTKAAGGDFRQIRADEEEISKGTPQSSVLQSSDQLHSDGTFSRDRTDSAEDGRNFDETDGGAGGSDREPESSGYDEVGLRDEQSPEQSAGDREGGSHLRLDYYDREREDKSLPFFGGDDTIREILGKTPHLKASKDEIRAFYESNSDNAARTEYIKGIFNNDYTELILNYGRRVGYKTWQNVLQLWEGNYESRTTQSFYDWGVIAQYFEAMRMLGELRDTGQPLPSMDGQLNFLDMQAEEKTSAFSFSQEVIDAVLTRGSGVSEGKFRIYEQFEKSLSAKENADFLKEEYGFGGAYPVIVGAGINEQHDGKGILISKGIGDDQPYIRLTWNQVEKRIAELIRLDRYLNPKEKEIYPQWLEKQEEQRAKFAEEQRNREILSYAPPEQESVQVAESEPQQEAHYAYHLGDTVYMGADEYEILSLNDERVMLFDTQFPLLNKEMDRAEFDRRVRENPMNDHLKVKNLPPEEKTDEAPAFDIGMGYLGNGLTVWNRAVEENGDYQTIAHISSEGEIHYYVDGLPGNVISQIERAAESEKENSRFADIYREYSEIKSENPDSIVLYQRGDFFEAYGEDAQIVGEALELNLTFRYITNNQRTELCNFPENRLETYTNMLLDRGFDVAISSLGNGERNTRNIVSTNKEDPVQSQPIGRIDYLHTDGTVRESIEYTSLYQFEKDVKEENYYGVPMGIILYKDKDGNVIPHEFISGLDPPPQYIELIDSPYLQSHLETAKQVIDEYCYEEFDHGADFSDLKNIGVGYTTTEDEEHEIQARVNLVDYRLETLADGKVIRSEQFSSLEDMIERSLQSLSVEIWRQSGR